MSSLISIDYCERCPLGTDANPDRGLAVPGRGPTDAELYILGEAPGRNEASEGRPFVGEAGRQLENALTAVGIPLDKVYFDNVVRHRPPTNRKPQVKEKTACSAWTELTLSLLKPRLILALGDSALSVVLPKVSLSEARGKVHEYRGIPLIVGYHPAAGLYDVTKKPLFKADLHFAAEYLGYSLPTKEQVDYYVNPAQLPHAKVVAIDVEWDKEDGSIVGVGYSWAEAKAAYLTVQDSYHELQRAVDATSTVVMHNSKGDVPALARVGIIVSWEKVEDTMLKAYVLRMPRVGLKELVAQHFGHEMTHLDELIGRGKSERRVSEVPVEDIAPYCCADADWTLRLNGVLNSLLDAVPSVVNVYRTIDLPLVPVLTSMEKKGILIDVPRLQALDEELQQKLSDTSNTWEYLSGGINPDSPKQLSEYLYGKLGLPPPKKASASGGLSTDKMNLERLKGVADGDALATLETLTYFRKLAKRKRTYTEGILAALDEENRLHTTFKATSVETGRLSSGDPFNVQNVPHSTGAGDDDDLFGKAVRSLFIASPGHVFICGDQSQIELRLGASISGDATLIHDLLTADVHSMTATRVWHLLLEDVTKQQRYTAKQINYNIWYGGGAEGLAPRWKITLAEAKSLLKEYLSVYTGVEEYFQAVRVMLNQRGYVETLYGRRNYYPDWNSSINSRRNAALREAANMIIQGTAADAVRRMMVAIHRELQPYQAWLLLAVHDELLTEVLESQADAVFNIHKHNMEHILDELSLAVPTPVDIGIGLNWLEAKH